ncbi:MAG: ABC transporter permease, partial [Calditrichaeota bacterium]
MLKNYLKIALRNLRRYKQYALINIVGLAVSLACLIFILLFVKHEWSYDRFQADADRIYRVAQDVYFRGAWVRVAVTPPIMAPALPQEFPEIQKAGRVVFRREWLIARGNKKFTANLQFVDPEIVSLMSIDMIMGDAEALRRSHTVAISQTWAQKLFGSDNPIGQTLRLNNRWDLEVVGVFRDYPENSHLYFEVMISLETLRTLWGPRALENENSNNYYTYILLDEHAEPAAVEAKLPAFIRKFYGEHGPQTRRAFLESLPSIYLHSETLYDVRSSGNAYYLYILLAVALAVLGIACMNFINLATAQSLRRAREIGVRKVCGGNRWAILRQFLAESVIVSLLAFALALAMAELLMPVFVNL